MITQFLKEQPSHHNINPRILLGDLPELSVQILEVTREHGRVTVNGAGKATGANRSTIKDHIKSLLKNGHLERHGAGRGTWYSPG